MAWSLNLSENQNYKRYEQKVTIHVLPKPCTNAGQILVFIDKL